MANSNHRLYNKKTQSPPITENGDWGPLDHLTCIARVVWSCLSLECWALPSILHGGCGHACDRHAPPRRLRVISRVAGLSCDQQMVRRRCRCDVKITLNEIIVMKARNKSAPTFRTFLNQPHVARKFRRFFQNAIFIKSAMEPNKCFAVRLVKR